MVPHTILCWSLTLLLPVVRAQEKPPATPPVEQPAKPTTAPTEAPLIGQGTGAMKPLVRHYPQDRDVPIATLSDHAITLGDLVDHIDARHHPGFRDALGVRPEIQRMLESDLMAPWVRQFADIQSLQFVIKGIEIDQKKLEAEQSEQLKKNFQAYLDHYVEQRRSQGRPTDFTQEQVNRMLARYQLENGLAAELQGWLNFLEQDNYTRGQMQAFFNDNARAFGGTVTVEHILIQNRDPGTGLLLDEAGQARAIALLADVKTRLNKDGSNFEEIAKLCSADQRTAPKGGLLGNVHRFDERLPAALCRAAWNLQDGEVSDVVESPYGWHILKRVDFQQQIFILFTDDAIPTIRSAMRRSRQENLLFVAREKSQQKLLL